MADTVVVTVVPNQKRSVTVTKTGGVGPAGPPGPPGPPGPQGDPSTVPGPVGPTGAASTVPGPTGPAGPIGPTGHTEAWHNGAGAPSGTLGTVGDWYLNTTTGDVSEKTGTSTWAFRANITGPQGVPGDPGVEGPKGDKGEGWYSSTGTPSPSTGVVGDWHLNTTTGAVSEKTGTSTWTVRANIKGPQGDPGEIGEAEAWYSGTAAPTVGLGEPGDWYLNATTGVVSEKVDASTWTTRANIKGPAGATGSQGIAGPQGVKGDTGSQGPTGAAGSQGIAGPKGDPGVQGPQGPQGSTGEGIHILGELATPAALPPTGNAPGDAYIVTSDGDLYVWTTQTDPDSWLDAGQVVGPQGPIGPQGVQGPPGSDGAQGVTGPAGAQGVAGAAGATGIQGPKGDTGAQGPQGIQGIQGPSGQAAGKILYLASSDASDIATYKTLLESPSAGSEQTIATPCTGTGDVLIASFVTDPGIPGAVDYPAGTGYRRIYAMVQAGTARLHMQVYKRNAAGTETLVRDELSDNFTNQVVLPQDWSATAAAAGALLATDRIVTKLYGQRVTGPTTVTVTTYYEGSAHASSIQTTITTGAQGPAGPPGPAGPGIISTTRAALDALAASSSLTAGLPYLLTSENPPIFAVATSATNYINLSTTSIGPSLNYDSIKTEAQFPAGALTSDGAIELGTRFKRAGSTNILVRGVRFYRSIIGQAQAPIVYLAPVGGGVGSILASKAAVSASPSSPLWETVLFDTPVTISTSGNFLVWVWLPTGGYYGTTSGLPTDTASRLGLFIALSGGGVFKQPPTGTNGNSEPTSSFQNSFYWVDPLGVGIVTDTNGDGPNLATMSDGELIAWMGTDATRWAYVFELAAGRVPEDDDERRGWLIGWFANAIEAGRADR